MTMMMMMICKDTFTAEIFVGMLGVD